MVNVSSATLPPDDEQALSSTDADAGLSIVVRDGKEFVRAGTIPRLIDYLIGDKAPGIPLLRPAALHSDQSVPVLTAITLLQSPRS
jgi:hypothetical protein